MLNVAYTVLPSTENALPPLNAAAAPAGKVPVLPRIVSVAVSNRKGPAMNLEPSLDADMIERIPDTFLLLSTVPEATSYTKRRFVESPIIRFPDAVVTRPARKLAAVGLGLIVGRPAAGVGGGVIGTALISPVAGSKR